MHPFDNRFVRELPGDPSTRPGSRQVFGACYSRVTPVQPSQPQWLAVSSEVAAMLGIDAEAMQSETLLKALSGHTLLPGMEPFAMCYGGHQFGHWAGQLGDGRAINLGEAVSPEGQRFVLQLKGAGPTPYSRHADGFAVLRSSVREFLCSEAMAHLGVPTTRALSLIGTGDLVVRDMFYDGRPRREPGAIVCRVAPSFIRFGNFEIFAARQDDSTLRKLIDYTIRNDYSQLLGSAARDSATELPDDVLVAWFHEVCRRTAVMVVHWMRVGFVHGVMNTDNMSILGVTIDYGPYGWLEDYDPTWTPNTTDAEGRRYGYGQQPQVAYWNLAQLANALHRCFADSSGLESGLNAYVQTLQSEWEASMAGKLGLGTWQEPDAQLVDSLFTLLKSHEIDMTCFYRLLGDLPLEGWLDRPVEEQRVAAWEAMRYAYYEPERDSEGCIHGLVEWLDRYARRLQAAQRRQSERCDQMRRYNPKYVLRNYLAQLAIDAAEQGDSSEISKLLEVLRHPYDEQPGCERYAEKRPDWAKQRAGCSMLSCSS
jgi:uncharacterized protein YdiU (UPF0061 family)